MKLDKQKGKGKSPTAHSNNYLLQHLLLFISSLAYTRLDSGVTVGYQMGNINMLFGIWLFLPSCVSHTVMACNLRNTPRH